MIRKGFVDIQVNGWMGADFTAPGLTVDCVNQITRDLVARGTVAYCPTVVTGPRELYRKNLRVIAEAMREPDLGRHILGIHLEGPFLSPEPGAVGAHPTRYIRRPSIRLFDQIQEWADGNIRILTVAPERPGALDLIRHAIRRGVTVAIGHHMADDDQLDMAVKAGATMCVHFANGIPNEIHRHRNPLWWTLACDKITAMLVTDGHHVPPHVIDVALRAKDPGRVIVTSDASALSGMPPGRYKTFGGLPVTIDKTGMIYSGKSKSLAGSHSTMAECMNHLASLKLLNERQLWQVGLINPLRLLGMTPGDLARLDSPGVSYANGRFRVRKQRRGKAKLTQKKRRG